MNTKSGGTVPWKISAQWTFSTKIFYSLISLLIYLLYVHKIYRNETPFICPCISYEKKFKNFNLQVYPIYKNTVTSPIKRFFFKCVVTLQPTLQEPISATHVLPHVQTVMNRSTFPVIDWLSVSGDEPKTGACKREEIRAPLLPSSPPDPALFSFARQPFRVASKQLSTACTRYYSSSPPIFPYI